MNYFEYIRLKRTSYLTSNYYFIYYFRDFKSIAFLSSYKKANYRALYIPNSYNLKIAIT